MPSAKKNIPSPSPSPNPSLSLSLDNKLVLPEKSPLYTARPLQESLHNTRSRFCVMVCHRRFGKTVAAINDLLMHALRPSKENWRAAYMAPFLRQAKNIAWDYLKSFAGSIEGVKFNESELRCDLPNNSRIRLYGTDNAEALRGMYLDDLVLDEPADMPRKVWTNILLPTLVDRKGRALFIGTPKGTNNLLYDVWQNAAAKKKNWSKFMFKASETAYIDLEELEDAKKNMDEDEYAQEFECSFAAAVRGAYYAHIIDKLEKDGQICELEYEEELQVHTAWDLGMDDATCIWFFQVDHSNSWRILDYYENSGEGLSHYINYVLAKPYQYGRHIAPHDIRVRELGTGKSRLETALTLGIRFEPCPNIPLVDGIHAVRQALPKMWFNSTNCTEAIRALRHYRKNWNPNSSLFGDKPIHDFSSHPSDALRYAVIGYPSPKSQNRSQERTYNKKTK